MSLDKVGAVAVVVAIAVLQWFSQNPDTVAPHRIVAVLELLGAPLVWAVASGRSRPSVRVRLAMSAFLSVLVAVCVANAFLLLALVMEQSSQAPIRLLLAGFGVMGVNMLSFGLIYWWLDAADPVIRSEGGVEYPDFLFPQQALAQGDWQPRLLDYVYVSFTNLLAFSPTDTMPLRVRTKILFMVQSTVSTFCALVILGHAINSLPN